MTIQQHTAADEGANTVDRPALDQASRRRFLQSALAAAVATMTTTGRGAGQTRDATQTDVSAALGAGPPQLDTTPATYVLFLDMREVEELVLCEQVVNQAEKHPHNPVLGPGDLHDGDGDRAGNWAGSLVYDAEDQLLKMWYSGLDETSASGFPGVTSGSIATGLATLPKDGFPFLRAADPISRGSMTTKPIRVKNAVATQLSLNVSHTAPWRDWVEVEVLDARSSRPIAGYGREKGRVMRDGTAHKVQWRDHTTLAAVGAAEIRLRFHFYGAARLYSYTFLPG